MELLEESLASTETCGDIPSFVCNGIMVSELREFNNKKKKKNT